ncbi:ABC transporter ATP-binding protein [Ruixingdingia sedimenti]|uniref:ABC transporter ATP-binding protein n=1 Tax=Ruixingdingia sedimenti TaxID=3073604 RepID=A0ABU1F3T0_9RHOB|nr:ABC transporter ATP-binding protein [Xinfangfangia sp. LG-4]MDR5651530.1 ABC transporter ATP-binding protein [Xinfangfangia sp. LG-4]
MAYDLQLSHVGKVYDNGTPAVIDFNLDVEKGEFIAFLGPSGCGKTTTLRMIAGFESITSGDLLIRGNRVNDLLPEKRPTSMIFQNYALFPHMSVRQNVRFGLEVKQMPAAEADAKVDRILDKLGLSDVAHVRPTRLSGGQRQRIALARSLVVEPDILLLDEPLGALDANLRKSIQNELKLLQRDLGITFVFVTHAQSEALALSDRIVVMNAGRVEQISPPRELYTRPQSLFVARFIGANTLIPGTLRAVEGEVATLDTAFGALAGMRPPGQPAAGAAVSLVLPAEAVDILPGTATEAERAAYGTNLIPCRIERLQLIGHILQIAVRLPNDELVNLEGHADKYGGRLHAGTPGFVAWQPERATVIAN